MEMLTTLTTWSARRWLIAAAGAVLAAFAIGVPTDVIPNPVFGRPVDVTWWSYPVLAVSALLVGLLVATYVREETVNADTPPDTPDTPGTAGGLGGLLSFFAVGCPTCNKLVVLAIGSTGALDWFAPAQPLLAGLSIALLAWALRMRLQGATACRIAV